MCSLLQLFLYETTCRYLLICTCMGFIFVLKLSRYGHSFKS